MYLIWQLQYRFRTFVHIRLSWLVLWARPFSWEWCLLIWGYNLQWISSIPRKRHKIMYVTVVELGAIIISFIVILKCHDNRNRREIFNIVILPTWYYHKYCDYCKNHCSETFILVKYIQLICTLSACSTVKWNHDNIDYHDNYPDDYIVTWNFCYSHPYTVVNLI